MIKNYIKIALRNFRRNIIYTSINIIGLALGLAGSFVIGSWVWQELSYDKHFENNERIFRVSISFFNSGAFATGPEILNETLIDQAPEVELTTRMNKGNMSDFHIGENTFNEIPFFADSNFFKIFSYHFAEGDPSTALSNNNGVVITTQIANKFFGRTNVLGQSILLEEIPYVISGVVEIPENPSHISANIWFPTVFQNNSNWSSAHYYSYVKLKAGFSENLLKKRLEGFKKDYVYPIIRPGATYEELDNTGLYDFHIVSLTDIHLNSSMRGEIQPNGNRANVYIFLIIAVFLVSIAAINFINLSTAQSTKRAKEVGIRKVFGTSRENLILRYLIESTTLSLIALVLGVGLAEVFLILFQAFTNEQLITGLFTGWTQIIMYTLFSLVIGIIAGIYPAFYLSHYRPADVLKSQLVKEKNAGFRNALVVIQFTISIALIICSLFVYNQLQFLRTVDLGFDRENIFVIKNASVLANNKEFFKERIAQHSEVKSLSFNKRIPSGRSLWVYSFQSKNMEQSVGFQTFPVDDQYLETMGFRLLEGRNFSKEIASDSLAIILTESAVKELLLDEPIVGTELQEGRRVIGVVSDFNYGSYTEKSDPVVMIFDPNGYHLSLKIRGIQTANFIDFVQQEWQKLSPDQPLSYSFVDDNFEVLMEKDKTLAKTISFFTTIAIFISCLGLFGLAAFTAHQRQKEIGVRKVLGATIISVIILLNKSFTRLVFISVIIAIPLSWYIMQQWLQNFQYKTDLNIFVFLLSGLAALVIAWFTVGYLSFNAAKANPVDSLRDE